MDTSKDNCPIVVFIPKSCSCESGYLYGEVTFDNLLKTRNFFIHEIYEDLDCAKGTVIGMVGNNVLYNNKCPMKKGNWVGIRFEDKMPFVDELISDRNVIPNADCQIIVYDKSKFIKSELLLKSNSDYEEETCTQIIDDHFKSLTYSLKQKYSHKSGKELLPFVTYLLITPTICLRVVMKIFNQFVFITKFSSFGLHMCNFVTSSIWALESVKQNKGVVSLKTGNYILGLMVDWVSGLLLIYWFMELISIEDVLEMLASQSEIVVVALRDTVRYLMGSPADLKLNGPLNNVLGRFFLFHIDLWWAFLGYVRPLLELGFHVIICLGSLGLSFQLAMFADVVAFASFHVYIIYVYAAKLYHAQVLGLATLSRVFLGRKRNPLPGRVDSCPYSTEQLLIGTIAFTVLLFLLPTTLVYYIVFTALRLLQLAVTGLLTRARLVLSSLPVYTTLLWLCNSSVTMSCVRLSVQWTNGNSYILEARPVQNSWWDTVRASLPYSASSAPSSRPLSWRELIYHLISGQLVYPV